MDFPAAWPLNEPVLKRRLLFAVAGFAAAAVGVTVLLYAVAAALRPDVVTPPAPAPAAQLAAVERARRDAEKIDVAHPPVITKAVDYRVGASAAWWPKGEA